MKIFVLMMSLLFWINALAQKDYGCATGQERVEATNSSLEKEVLRLVNIERRKVNLSVLQWRDELGYSARYHAKDMAEDNYIMHDSYDRVNGRLVKTCNTFSRIKKFFVSGFAMAENISAGRSSAEAIVNGWMKSPDHKANILRKEAKYLGVGFYTKKDSSMKYYCVQCFGQ